LDKHAAARLQMKREVERVRERMTLKHKNTTRWAKHALKQQKHNPALAAAVSEQIARGEHLRKKQMDANSGVGSGEEDDSDSGEYSDDTAGEGEGEEGGGGEGQSRDAKLLWRLLNEEEPVVPEKGVFGMAFMRRASEKRKREAEEMLAEMGSPPVLPGGGGNTGGGGAHAGRAGAGTGGEGSEDGSEFGRDSEGEEDGTVGSGQRYAAAGKRAARAGGVAGRRKLAQSASRAGRAQAAPHSEPAPPKDDSDATAAGRKAKASRAEAALSTGPASGIDKISAPPHAGPTPSGDDIQAPVEGKLRVSRSAAPILINSGVVGTTGSAAGDAEGAEDLLGSDAGPPRKKTKNGAAMKITSSKAVSAKGTSAKAARTSSVNAAAAKAAAAHAASAHAEESPPGASASPSPPVFSPTPAPPLILSRGKPVSLSDPLILPSSNTASGAGDTNRQAASVNGKPDAPPRRTKARGGVAAAAAAAAVAAAAEGEADMNTAADDLTAGASLLLPSAAQQSLVDAAFPESAELAAFAAEKQALVEAEAGVAEDPQMPGWGDWSGMGARVGRRQQERKRSAAEAREEQLAEAAARRKDSALRHVILSEKRDKKAAKFTVAAVPFPFKTREQFERSMRNPLGTEWNTVQSHAQLIQPRVSTVRGALIQPVSEKKRVEAAAHRRGARRT
jgi:U3 small nucleolar RNA-associated protein 14